MPVRVTVVAASPDVLAETLAYDIRSDDRFVLDHEPANFIDENELYERAQQRGAPQVAVLVGSERWIERVAVRLAEADADLDDDAKSFSRMIVARMIVKPDLQRFNFFGAPFSELAERLLHARAGDQFAFSYRPPDSVFATRVSNLGPRALAWIDAVIRRLAAARYIANDQSSGLAVTRAMYDHVMSADYPPTKASADAAVLAATVDLFMELEFAPNSDPLKAIRKRLDFGPEEFGAFLLCLAPELDPKYHVAFAYLHNDTTRPRPSLGLIGELLGDPQNARHSLSPPNVFTRWRLLASGHDLAGDSEQMLKLDKTVVDWLMGPGTAFAGDPKLSSIARTRHWPGVLCVSSADRTAIQDIAKLMRAERDEWLILDGDCAMWRVVLEEAAKEAKRVLLRIPLSGLRGVALHDIDEAAFAAARAAQLSAAIVVLDLDGEVGSDQQAANRFAAILHEGSVLRIVLVKDKALAIEALGLTSFRLMHRTPLDAAARAHAFGAAAKKSGGALTADEAMRIGTDYPFTIDKVEQAVVLACELHESDARDEKEPPFVERLSAACRQLARPSLPRFARHMPAEFKLDDVVLPRDRADQLKEIVAHIQLASPVLDGWGFGAQLPQGRGVAALFSGASGTGKTMSAQAIAHALRADLFIVDLARVVSKFIGETEKNLDAAFSDAERGGAVLLFDEADALFGKRSEVKDAHDRYANIEVAYLLQRMESFSGLAILTTNFRQNLDSAFTRRLRFIVDFPKPDVKARETIWEKCFPDAAPRAKDVNLGFLARCLDLSGGHIRQITVRAAFLAKSQNAKEIAMTHVVQAARAELVKLGMQTSVLDAVQQQLARNANAAAA